MGDVVSMPARISKINLTMSGRIAVLSLVIDKGRLVDMRTWEEIHARMNPKAEEVALHKMERQPNGTMTWDDLDRKYEYDMTTHELTTIKERLDALDKSGEIDRLRLGIWDTFHGAQ